MKSEVGLSELGSLMPVSPLTNDEKQSRIPGHKRTTCGHRLLVLILVLVCSGPID